MKLRKVFLICSFVVSSHFAFSSTAWDYGRLGVNVPPKTEAYKGKIQLTAPSIICKDDILTLSNGHAELKVSTNPSLKLESLFSKYAESNCLTDSSRLFFIWVDGKRFEESDFKVKNIVVKNTEKLAKADIEIESESGQIAAKLSIAFDESPEIRLGLSIINNKRETKKLRMMFPYFENLQIGENGDDNYYYFPYKGGICSNRPYELLSGYNGAHNGSIQLLSLYNPKIGAGIYTRIDDKSGTPKTFIFRKKDGDANDSVRNYSSPYPGIYPEVTFTEKDLYLNTKGSVLGCYSYYYDCEPNAIVSLPSGIVGIHGGDFTFALDMYSKWLRSWWKHDVGTPQWYKDCYFYPVAHDIAGNTGWVKGFIQDNKIALSQIARPYEDIIQVAVWGEHPKDDQLGDKRDYSWYRFAMPGNYNYEESWGGLPALREEIKKARMIGPRISLYGATQYGTWLFSDVYKQHPDWAQLDQQGREVHEYWWDLDNNKTRVRIVNMCGQIEEWQDHVAKTNHRIIKDTGASGIFLDVMNQIPFCYNLNHKHEKYPAIAAEKLLKKNLAAVRSVDPEAVIEIEDFCSDYLLQWVDGCWLKTFVQDMSPSIESEFDLYSVSFIRFMFPEVKWNAHGPRWIFAGRRALFNGISYNISDVENKNDDAEANKITVEQRMDYLISVCHLMKESGDVFSSTDCRCLVPTLQDRIYANYFASNGKKFYTLYNKNSNRAQGQIIKTEGGSGYHCIELLNDNEIEHNAQNGTVTLEVAPWEVVCVARLPEVMSLQQQLNTLDVTMRKSVNGGYLKLYVDTDDGKEAGERIEVRNDLARINLTNYQGKRLIIKLFEGGYLLDERIIKLNKTENMTLDK